MSSLFILAFSVTIKTQITTMVVLVLHTLHGAVDARHWSDVMKLRHMY